eukprot:TRINITY_DN18078_c0_g1_i1.p1 TRINITY_DN18078_c0_g1~~TRINITY_DN18078_c0_g1_i1.p1  ORF type:complete len:214 (-),score=43.10 TRINITY_DN18078_c0_g1_i1:264-905(-)
MDTGQLVGHGITLFLLLCSWIIALSGLAAMQERCNSVDIFMFANVTSMAPKTCGEFYSYMWWQIALEFFFWVYYATVLAVGEIAMKQQKLAISTLTAVLMLLYMQTTTLFYDVLVADPQYLVLPPQTYTAGNYTITFLPNVDRNQVGKDYDNYISGSLRTRLQVTVSGFALVVFFHCVLIFIMSPFGEPEEGDERAVAGKRVGGATPPPPGTV